MDRRNLETIAVLPRHLSFRIIYSTLQRLAPFRCIPARVTNTCHTTIHSTPLMDVTIEQPRKRLRSYWPRSFRKLAALGWLNSFHQVASKLRNISVKANVNGVGLNLLLGIPSALLTVAIRFLPASGWSAELQEVEERDIIPNMPSIPSHTAGQRPGRCCCTK
jgi:hypothetical protein